MSDGRLQVSFGGPSYFLGQNLPVEIRDARNQLISRATGPVDLALPAGLYVVDATLPGGRKHSEVVALAAGEPYSVVLDAGSADDDGDPVLSVGPSLATSAIDRVPPAVLVDHRFCRATDQRGSKWRFDPEGQATEAPSATFSIAGMQATVSLPLNPQGKPAERGCWVRFVRRGDRVRVDVGFASKRQVASTLEGLVKSDDVVSTAALFSQAESVLYAKYRDPSAAALGGLTLHRIGRLPERVRWVENLARDFRWIADGQILLAAVLARSSSPDERARGLRKLLAAAPLRPLFGDGLALLLKLLRSWPDDDSLEQRRAALAAIPIDVSTVDWTAMALTTYDEG